GPALKQRMHEIDGALLRASLWMRWAFLRTVRHGSIAYIRAATGWRQFRNRDPVFSRLLQAHPVHSCRGRVGNVQNGVFRKTELMEVGPKARIPGPAPGCPASLQDVGGVKSDTGMLAHEPPDAAEPSQRTRRSALRPIGHDRVEPLGADLRSDTDAGKQ